MKRSRVIVLLGLVALIVLCSTVVSTASNTVAASRVGESAQTITANEFRPTECSALNLASVVAVGTGANELVVGTGAANVIIGGGGADCILGGAGGDFIFAGAGGDVALGMAGNDWIFGGGGTDTCYGGAGTDNFFGCETQIP